MPPSNASPSRPGLLLALVLSLGLPSAAPALAAAPGAGAGDGFKVVLAPLVTRLLQDPAATPAEKRRLALFHGQWSLLEKPTPAEAAALALFRHDLANPALTGPAAPPLLRAQAALASGDPALALELLRDQSSALAALLRAQAHEQLGQSPAAVSALAPWRQKLLEEPISDAAELTAAAEALSALARLEGQPARDYQTAIGLLGKARGTLDRLYWPAMVAEARLLADKDNAPEALDALREALCLNPSAGEAWYLLGQIAAQSFNFELAARCVSELSKINPAHPLAALLQTQVLLTQKDHQAARDALAPVLKRFPRQREALALRAAVEALAYREKAMEQELAGFQALAPGNAQAHFVAGRYLSMGRQYTQGEAVLRQAMALQPNWAAPRTELGLALMQSGDEEAAHQVLAEATRLDPFNRRAANQLKLLEQLRDYKRIRTEHFEITCRPGIDEALARDMPAVLESIYRDVTSIFGHRPARVTKIQIMPDEQAFGVRITGMPWIWTIGACTGDVIAITPPRSGPKQRGHYDWARVIRHEFTHTVTLDQTANRIPHWFTEACAVAQEPGPRDFDTCKLLASALQSDKLFTLDQINWAFIRPKTPRDRPLAYAQANWMLEYITATHTHATVIALLEAYRGGTGDEQAIQLATGSNADAFLASFKSWAREQVKSWGLAPHPADAKADPLLAASPRDPKAIAALLAEHPDHPGLLHAAALAAVDSAPPEAAREAVMRYASARPVDPWADRALFALAIKTGRTDEAVGALTQIDQSEQSTGDWARQLAEIHRAQGQLDQAFDSALRAIGREPYNATLRELAATLALQRGDANAAIHQVEAMATLEPQRAAHQVRLAALLARQGKSREAHAAALKARQIDPKAPVEKFLGPAETPAP